MSFAAQLNVKTSRSSVEGVIFAASLGGSIPIDAATGLKKKTRRNECSTNVNDGLKAGASGPVLL